MRDCCDLISSPLRLSIANIQTFVVRLHDSLHEMYSYIDQIKHHQVRVKKASVASKSKAEKDLNFVLAQFQDKLKSIEASYESPYMEKTRVHYPEMFQLLQQLRSKIQNDKRIKALVPTER